MQEARVVLALPHSRSIPALPCLRGMVRICDAWTYRDVQALYTVDEDRVGSVSDIVLTFATHPDLHQKDKDRSS
jgi:hypothetical protein